MVIFIVWIAFIPLKQKTKLNRIKSVYEKKKFLNVIMHSEDIKVLGLIN